MPAAVLIDFDDTLIDNSMMPATAEAWGSYSPSAERHCQLGMMDVLLEVVVGRFVGSIRGCARVGF